MGLFQLVALLLLVPIVVLEILIYAHYGVVGLLLAFFPVVLASFVLRGFSTMEEKYARVARENRELDVMREISNIFSLGARPDRYRRAFEALRRLLPVEAMAFAEWVEDTGEDMEIHLEGSTTAGRHGDPRVDPEPPAPRDARRDLRDRLGAHRRAARGPALSRDAPPADRAALDLRAQHRPPHPRELVLRAPVRRRRRIPHGRWRGRSRSSCRTVRSARRSRSSPAATATAPRRSTRSSRSPTRSRST